VVLAELEKGEAKGVFGFSSSLLFGCDAASGRGGAPETTLTVRYKRVILE